MAKINYLENVAARREKIAEISNEELLRWLLAFYQRSPDVEWGSPQMEMMWEIEKAVLGRMKEPEKRNKEAQSK